MKSHNILSKVLTPVGYAWGIAAAICGTAVFFFFGPLSHTLAQQPFMRVHPIYSGAEVVKSESTADADWRIHRPVFDGLISETDHGFIQIDVICKNHQTKSLRHAFDYNSDGTEDFALSIPNAPDGVPTIEKTSPEITGIERWAKTREGWIIRIGLDKR
jgi:hypothetical protein